MRLCNLKSQISAHKLSEKQEAEAHFDALAGSYNENKVNIPLLLKHQHLNCFFSFFVDSCNNFSLFIFCSRITLHVVHRLDSRYFLGKLTRACEFKSIIFCNSCMIIVLFVHLFIYLKYIELEFLSSAII